MTKEFGKGRVFHTSLGHGLRNMENLGFQTLMLRGTEWAATGNVKQCLPQQLRKSKGGKFNWAESDTTFVLMNGKAIVWQQKTFYTTGKREMGVAQLFMEVKV